MESQRKLPYRFYEHVFQTKTGRIKYNMEKIDKHGRPTVRYWHKEAYCLQRRARDRASIPAARRTLRQNSILTAPVIGVR